MPAFLHHHEGGWGPSVVAEAGGCGRKGGEQKHRAEAGWSRRTPAWETAPTGRRREGTKCGVRR